VKLRSPLNIALGLGSSGHGFSHWWWQRLSAIALVPLSIWFVWSVLTLIGADFGAVTAWLRSPIQSSLLLLFVLVSLFHGQTGVQVVIEDYVHTRWLGLTLNLLVKGAALLMAAIAIVSILKVTVGV
jgi:succinate dehydrogenase / fumarate reductase membrane anchor subunit